MAYCAIARASHRRTRAVSVVSVVGRNIAVDHGDGDETDVYNLYLFVFLFLLLVRQTCTLSTRPITASIEMLAVVGPGKMHPSETETRAFWTLKMRRK